MNASVIQGSVLGTTDFIVVLIVGISDLHPIHP